MAGNSELTNSAGNYSKDQANEALALVDSENIDTVPTAVLGNISVFDATGNLVDSNIPATSIGNVGTKVVSETNIGDSRILAYNSVSGELEYVDNTGSGGSNWGDILGNILDQTDLQNQFATTDGNLTTHINTTTNPHVVTKAQVGLGSVDNTADLDKPVSTLTQSALDAKENGLGNPAGENYVLVSSSAGVRQWLDPATLGVASINGQVGVVVLTTDDIGEGTTNLYYTAARADSRVQAAIQDTTASPTTLYSSTKIEALLAGALNYKGSWDADTNTPIISDGTGANGDFYKVSTAGTQDLGSGAIVFVLGDDVIHNGSVYERFGSANAVESVNGQIGIVVLGALDVGLGNVDNTSDLNKPISTATQTALNDKSPTSHTHAGIYEPANANIQNHIVSSSNPHAVTKAQVDLGNVDNTADIDKPVSNATQIALNAKADQTSLDTTNTNVGNNTSAINSHVSDLANPHGVTKVQLGLSNVDNTADIDKPISSATQIALDAKEGSLGNPTTDGYILYSTSAGVRSWAAVLNDAATWGNISGLLVDQTDLQNALDDKAALNHNHDTVYEPINSNIQTHIADMNNPHGLTAAQLGLGNVDNTSDINKPISDATQLTLDNKTEWKGEWVQAEYLRNHIVRDGAWTMVALTTTTERAGPIPSGDPSTSLPEVPAWATNQTSTQVDSGQIYTFNVSGWITSLRIWVPAIGADIYYHITIINLTDPAEPLARILPLPALTVGAWVTVALGSETVTAGTIIKIKLGALNQSATTQFSGNWTFAGTGNNLTPIVGEWALNQQHTSINVNKTDLASADRSAELGSVMVNTRVKLVQVSDATKWDEFLITGAETDNGTYFTYPCARIGSGSSGSVDELADSTATFDVPVAASTDYVQETDTWLTNPSWATVDGFLDYDGVAQPSVANNAYGVDMEFQEAYVSPDWDLMSTSESGVTGGSSGATIEVVNNLTSTDATAALSANMGRELNVTKADIAGNNAQIFKAANGLAGNDVVNFQQTSSLLESKEDYLGSPTSDDMVLVSTVGDIRSWAVLPVNTDISAIWGNITGLVANQTDLQTILDGKSDINHNHDGTYEPANANIQAHITNVGNPHSVTQSQIGLGNVDNTSDANKPVSISQQAALDAKENSLNNPTISGQFLVSTTAGARSWITFENTDIAAVWGNITGLISDQTDLQDALNLKFDKTGGIVTGDIDIVSGTGAKLNIETSVVGGQPQLHLSDSNSIPRGVFGTDTTTGEVGITRLSSTGVEESTLRLDSLGNVKALAGSTGTLPIPTDDFHFINKKFHDDGLATKENSLGLPPANSYILSSDTLGNRSWVAPSTIGVTSVNGQSGTVVLGTDDVAEGAVNLYYTATRADDRVQAAIQDTVASTTTLYSSSKIDSLVSGALSYKGSWNANTNTPTISNATGANGDFYKCEVAGTQDLGSGSIIFEVGDDVIHNGTIYERFGSTSTIDSVNGQTGVVVLGTDDIAEGITNLYYTDARVEARLSVLINDAVTVLDFTWSSTKIADAIQVANDAIIFPVTQVNGKTGAVTVTKDDVQLGNVDNTSDANKPVSGPQQIALDGKSDTNHDHAGVYEPANANIQNHISTIGNPHATALVDLTDTPAILTGQAGARVAIKADESGFEYVKPSAIVSEAKPTGLVDGGELNIISADVEVLSGLGAKIDSYTNPSATPTVVELSWNTIQVAIDVLTPIAGDIVYMLLLDSGVAGPVAGTNLATLHQSVNSVPSPSIVRDEIYLGYVVYNGVSWGEVSSPIVVNSSAVSLAEYIRTVAGPSFVQSGGATHESGIFSLDRDSGVVWELNRSWHINKKDPHRESFNEALAFSWRYVNRDFSTVSVLTSTVDPTQYDNNGIVEAVGGTTSTTTIQRVYIDPRDNYWVMYGQNTYDSYDDAVANIGIDATNTVTPMILEASIFLGYIVSEKAETAWLSDNARFISVIEAMGGGSGSAPIDTFVGLIDTPNTYVGAANKILAVNVGETAIEFQTLVVGVGEYVGTNIIHDSNDGDAVPNITGVENNVYGYQAGEFLTSGDSNILIGTRAGRGDGVNTLTGNFNVCVGWQSGMALTTGTENVLMGSRSGETLTTESNQLRISNALSTLISGDFNTKDVAIDAELKTKLVTFQGSAPFANGDKAAAWTLAPRNGQYQQVTLTGSNTVNFTPPTGPCTFYLHIYQDATGNRVLTLPVGQWVNGLAKPNTLTANAHDLLMVHYYGGSNYVYEMMLNLS